MTKDNDTDKDAQIAEESKENEEDSVSEAHNGRVEEDEDVDNEIRDLTWEPRRNDGLEYIDKEKEVVNYGGIETDDGESVSTNSSTRRQPVYLTSNTLSNKEEAVVLLENEKCWSMKNKHKQNLCKNTIHEYYTCNVSAKCHVKVCIAYSNEEEPVTIKRSSNIEHDHKAVKNDTWGLNYDTKKAIEHLYLMGTTTAYPIIHGLRDRMKISELVNVNVANLQEPTPRQVNNYLLNTFKPKILDKSHFNYGELYEWVLIIIALKILQE